MDSHRSRKRLAQSAAARPDNEDIDPPPLALVVESLLGVPGSAATALRRGGFCVSTVTSCREALARLDRDLPTGVLVLDVLVLRPTCFRLIETIRAHKYWSSVVLVVLSPGDTHDNIQRVFESGSDDYILKPIDGDLLSTQILRMITA